MTGFPKTLTDSRSNTSSPFKMWFFRTALQQLGPNRQSNYIGPRINAETYTLAACWVFPAAFYTAHTTHTSDVPVFPCVDFFLYRGTIERRRDGQTDIRPLLYVLRCDTTNAMRKRVEKKTTICPANATETRRLRLQVRKFNEQIVYHGFARLLALDAINFRLCFRPTHIHRVNDVTESMVTIRSPFCGYNFT